MTTADGRVLHELETEFTEIEFTESSVFLGVRRRIPCVHLKPTNDYLLYFILMYVHQLIVMRQLVCLKDRNSDDRDATQVPNNTEKLDNITY